MPLGEPDGDLALGGLNGVGAVNEVLLNLQAPVAAEVATNGAWGCRGGIRGARQGAEALDDTVTLEDRGNDRAGEHELNERLVERLANMLGVVRFQLLAGRGHLLQLGQGVPLGLDASQDGAGQVAGHAVGLDQDKSALSAHSNSKL